MHREAVLGTVDFDELSLRLGNLADRRTRGLDGDKGVPGAMNEQGRGGQLTECQLRIQVEDLVEQCPAQLERRRVRQEPLAASFRPACSLIWSPFHSGLSSMNLFL